MSKEVTIYDIARELSISPATVSRALSEHPGVNKKTRESVIKLAESLGYQSNTFASNLRKQKSSTIGVIVPRLNSYVMSSILSGMERVANENDYNLIISQSLEQEKKEKQNAKTMLNSRVDALLISLASDTLDIEHILPFIKKKIPVVFFDRVVDHPLCISIVIDNFKAGYEATEHLLNQGCKRLLHITGDLNRNVYKDRLRGFQFALNDKGLHFTDDTVISLNFNTDKPEDLVTRINEMKIKPDGLFITNDSFAASTMILLKQAGYRIPEDIAVFGFNDDPISKVVEPNLSTVYYPAIEMGELAVQTILGYLRGNLKVNYGSTVILRSEAIFRGSSLRK